MRPVFSAFGLAAALAAAPLASAQELDSRIGLTFFVAQPADTAGKMYGSGWKVGLNIFVRRGEPTEGRVRLEFGGFQSGKVLERSPYDRVQYSAQTRLVGYDWLLSLGERRETGVDFIFGIGGAHWLRDKRVTSAPGMSYPNSHSDTTHKLAFAGTVGFRFRINRQFVLELHHVLTSLPASDRDFEDAELSHTALGVGFRF